MRLQELSALLPDISANLSETEQQVNLAAYGFKFKLPPGLNFSIPSVVGPFSLSQAQAALSQSVWDPVARKNWQVAKQNDRAAAYSVEDARELVVLATAQSYLSVLSLDARVASQRAQVENAQAIYNQAVTRKEAGTNARIDVTRSLVEYQTEQQRLTSLDADLRKQKIALARVVGLPLGAEYRLSDGFIAPDAGQPASGVPDADTAIQEAWRTRRDLRATDAQVKAAELAVSAARAERLPSASINGDYGVIGPTPASTHGVFAVTGTVNIPIWQGGRVKGDVSEAEATLSQRRAELADARAHVEQDVRDALIELQAVTGQVTVAESNRQYANETLQQARDRFGAGVATTVEVVQAQEQVANAENDYISSLFAYDLAKLGLARATGKTETDLTNVLRGKQQ
jgi:outer membrane protein TolC